MLIYLSKSLQSLFNASFAWRNSILILTPSDLESLSDLQRRFAIGQKWHTWKLCLIFQWGLWFQSGPALFELWCTVDFARCFFQTCPKISSLCWVWRSALGREFQGSDTHVDSQWTHWTCRTLLCSAVRDCSNAAMSSLVPVVSILRFSLDTLTPWRFTMDTLKFSNSGCCFLTWLRQLSSEFLHLYFQISCAFPLSSEISFQPSIDK